MKAKVNLGLDKLSNSGLIARSRHFVTSMTGNSNFTTPVPTLASITTATNAFEAAYNAAQGGGPAQTSAMNDKRAILSNLLTQLGNYVESTAAGLETVILSAGMDVKAKGTRSPQDFNVKPGTHEGEVIVQAKVVEGASYIFEMSEDVPPAETPGIPIETPWKIIQMSTVSTITVSGLIPGHKYWFRVAPVKGTVQGFWSDPIAIIAI